MNNLNPHSRLASFYRYFYMTDTLPNNLCSYFWSLLLAVMLSPFVWIAMYQNYRKNVIKLVDYDTYKYKRDANDVQYCEVIVKKRYDVGYSGEKNGAGLFYTFIAIVLGLITLSISVKMGLNLDLFNFIKDENPVLNLIFALSFFYIIGLITGLVVIAIVLAFIGVSRLIPVKPKVKLSDEDFYAQLDINREKDRLKHERREANPNFFVLAWRWLVAIKEKNCPMITWDYDNTDKK